MGKLFKAAVGFAVALTLLHGRDGWAGSPLLAAVKADIATSRPLARLQAQFGTAGEAYRLHPGVLEPKGPGQ